MREPDFLGEFTGFIVNVTPIFLTVFSFVLAFGVTCVLKGSKSGVDLFLLEFLFPGLTVIVCNYGLGSGSGGLWTAFGDVELNKDDSI